MQTPNEMTMTSNEEIKGSETESIEVNGQGKK